VLDRYTGLSAHDSNALASFVFRLSRLSAWPEVVEANAYRLAIESNALKGMKSLESTKVGTGHIHTAKVGISMTSNGSINTGVSLAAQFPNWANEGGFYGAYVHTLTKGANASAVFGSTVVSEGATLFNSNFSTLKFQVQIDTLFVNISKAVAYASEAALTAATQNVLVGVGRSGAWGSASAVYLKYGATEEPPVTLNLTSGGVTPPSANQIHINLSVNAWAGLTAAMFVVGTERLRREQLRIACDDLEVNLAA
jgi:hypothetical protein